MVYSPTILKGGQKWLRAFTIIVWILKSASVTGSSAFFQKVFKEGSQAHYLATTAALRASYVNSPRSQPISIMSPSIIGLIIMHQSQEIERLQLSQEEVNYWMGEALLEARKAIDLNQVPVGCVFVRRHEGRLQRVEGSHNLTNLHQNASHHCEVNCLNKMERNLSKEELSRCVLLVTVEPCIMCTWALNLVGIRLVYFGQFNDKFGGCGSVRKDHTFKIVGGIRQKESYQLIRDFYQRGNQRLPEQMRHRKRVKGE